MPAAVANRYARALVDAALSPAAGVEPARLLDELRDFQASLRGSAELTTVLASPAVAPGRKRAVVDQLTVGLPPIARNFLKTLIDHRRAASLGEILDAFERLMDERMGVVQVDLSSAQPLTEVQRHAVIQGLEAATGRQVMVNTAVKPELIGGVVARIGSTVYDGSVRSRLESLGRRLAAE